MTNQDIPVRICSVADCFQVHYGRGWCRKHHGRWKRRGSVEDIILAKQNCSVDGCPRIVAACGWCPAHYARWKRIGTTDGPPLGQLKKRTPIAERFWSWVDKNGSIPEHVPNIGNCWVWTGHENAISGYGSFNIGKARRAGAHVISWELAHPDIPRSGLNVCHRCDRRMCVRPSHLFLGTQKDNIADAQRKGRMLKGEQIAQARLREEDIPIIRELCVRGATQQSVADRFGVTVMAINKIILGVNWKHIS